MHAKLTVGLMFLPRTVILAQLEISCLSITQKEGRAKKERGIWRCNFYPGYTSPSCGEMLASIWSYCWKKGFAPQLSKTKWVFLSCAENSLVLEDVLIYRRCSVHPTSWVSCQGWSTGESLGTGLSYPESWFSKGCLSNRSTLCTCEKFPLCLCPCVEARWQLHVMSMGEFLES